MHRGKLDARYIYIGLDIVNGRVVSGDLDIVVVAYR
jgi:hypothetical protein